MRVSESDPHRRALTALLEWHVACGVDLALDAAPHDRYAESAKAPPPVAAAPARRDVARATEPKRPAPKTLPEPAARPAAIVFPEEAERAALAAAGGARTLAELAERFAAFDGCGFKSTARHFLLGAGAPGADLMIMDLAPGEEEERSGRPFDGARGRLLDAMLKAIGRKRDSAYLAYFSPWRPPGDKTPTPQEAAALLPFARRHIELAAPARLVALGEPLARALLGAKETGARLYGGSYEFRGSELRVPATAAPPLKAVLAVPTLKRATWRALRAGSPPRA